MIGRYWTKTGELVDVVRYTAVSWNKDRFLIGKELVTEAVLRERIDTGALRRFGMIASAQPRSEESYIGPRWNRRGNR